MTSPTRAPRGGLGLFWLGSLFMKLAGWRVTGDLPDSNKVVVIAAPHTSNWDFVFLLGAASVLRLKVNWLGKDTLFKPPFGAIMRMLGGIPVDRSRSTNLVQQLTARFAEASHLAVVIPPSGTRSKTEHWRSGFYWTAYESGATVACGFLDYPSRTAGVAHSFVPSGKVDEDMHAVRRSYQGIRGKYPDRMGAIRLKEEAGAEAAGLQRRRM